MNETRRLARSAAVFYALDAIIASAAFALDPGKLAHTAIVNGAVVRTLAATRMIRISMFTEAVYQTVEVFLAIALYRLFKPAGASLAQQMLAFALIPIPIVFINLLTEVAALMFVDRSMTSTAFDAEQRDLIVKLLIDLHGQGLDVAGMFWGLWLFPLGMLIIRSGFVPEALGPCSIVGGVGWILGSGSSLIMPGLVAKGTAAACAKVAVVFQIGELPFIVWLVFWGTRLREAP